MPIFTVGESYSRVQIAKQIGGNTQDFLIRSNGKVVGCCYKPTENIQAPATFLVGGGPKRFSAAERFAAQDNFIPFFRKNDTNNYAYIGDYRVSRSSKNAQVLEKEKVRGKDQNVGIALYLERLTVNDVRTNRLDGAERLPDNRNVNAWQPDPRVRKQVEEAAVQEVIRHFTALGYGIEDRQSENVGWDLEAVKQPERLLLEVKGLSAEILSVEVTANEYEHMRRHSEQYRICVVTKALETSLVLSIFRHATERQRWEDSLGVPLMVDEVVAARLHL